MLKNYIFYTVIMIINYFSQILMHMNRNVVTLVKLTSLAAMDIVIWTTSGSASDTNFHQYDDISVSYVFLLHKSKLVSRIAQVSKTFLHNEHYPKVSYSFVTLLRPPFLKPSIDFCQRMTPLRILVPIPVTKCWLNFQLDWNTFVYIFSPINQITT